MGGTGPLVVVKGDSATDANLGLRACLPGVQIDAFIFQGSPKTLDEDVVDGAALAGHRDPGVGPLQPIGPGEGCELAALIRVHDLGRAELVDRLVQRLDAEVRLPRV